MAKFTFPMPGRSPKQPPTLTISNPLSKAEKILGAGGVNHRSRAGAKDSGRSWETGSNGGISISVSESSASQHSDVEDDDDDRLGGTAYAASRWGDESEALPRRLRGTHGPAGKAVKPQRSAVTLGARSRDGMTDDPYSPRPQSSSTAYSHYESAKMPLSISQQTSNSAMAKGLPAKAGALLDIDGALGGTVQQKKKPGKLDFSKLRLRSRKDQGSEAHGVGPVLGNNYVTKSPSIMSHMLPSMSSLTGPSPTTPGSSRSAPKPDTKPPSLPTIAPMVKPGHLTVASDTNTLHQLYDHYEQMSFRYATDLTEDENEQDEAAGEASRFGEQHLLPRTYEPTASKVSLEHKAAPSPTSMDRDPTARWNHSRDASQASKATAARTATPGAVQLRPTSRSDYPASISSRHTRTSKATPSIMSTMDSDRQQQSVLSLTDSDSDEDCSRLGSPSYENSFRDDLSVSSSQRRPSASRLSVSSYSTNPKGVSYAHLNDFLTIPQASPKSKGSRSPSTNTMHSSMSSLSAAAHTTLPSPSPQDSRTSVSTNGTAGTILSPTYSCQTGYTVQEARMISYTPLASTAEAASSVSEGSVSGTRNRSRSRQPKQRTSQNSRASDQPTPPLSPASVEFYRKSQGSEQQEPATGNASDAYNARMMAVTRQEELLLAALRKKRARMRENIIAEMEEDRSTSSRASGSSAGLVSITSADLGSAERQDARDARARAKQIKNLPKRSSSLQRFPMCPTGIPSASHSDSAGKTSNRMSTTPEGEREPAGRTRHERVLLYLDRPIDSIDVIDQSEPSPDLSEFMEEDLEFPLNERRSRTRSRLTSYPNGPLYSSSSSREALGRPRPDSGAVSTKGSPSKEIPIITNQYMGSDEVDLDDLNIVIDRRKMTGLETVPETGVPKPNILSSTNRRPAPPMLGHKTGKKSIARLSAVGQVSSPVPWWGDDD